MAIGTNSIAPRTREWHQMGGRARQRQMTQEQLSIWGRRGADVTAERYGSDFLIRQMAAKRRRKPSAPEKQLLDVLQSLRLVEGADFERNQVVQVAERHCEIDVVLSRKRGIEADGARYHGSDEQRQRDSERDALLQAEGWRILRLPEETLASFDRTRSLIFRWLVVTGGLGDE